MQTFHMEGLKSFHLVWVFRSLMAFFTLLITSLLFHIVQYFYYPDETTPTAQMTPAAVMLQPPDASLFGMYVPQNLDDAHIQNSTLNLAVVGVMYAAAPGLRYILLRHEGGEEKWYPEGALIFKDVLIKKIEPRSIIIVDHGRLERLYLDKAVLQFQAAPPSIFRK